MADRMTAEHERYLREFAQTAEAFPSKARGAKIVPSMHVLELLRELDATRADLAELIAALPKCSTFGGEGPNGWGEQCEHVALWECVKIHVDGLEEVVIKCDEHKLPDPPEDSLLKPVATKWAAVLRKLASRKGTG